MRRTTWLAAALIMLPALGLARPTDRLVVKVLDDRGRPVPGANVMTIEGLNADYLRQGIIWADSNGVAVAEVGRDAILALRISARGFETYRLDLAPDAPERRVKVIEIRLSKKRSKGLLIPVSG